MDELEPTAGAGGFRCFNDLLSISEDPAITPGFKGGPLTVGQSRFTAVR